MELGLSNTLLPGDPRLIDHIVAEVKSQGIFDQFRKECIADVDTKPAYQNLRTRVESSVNSFLNKQTWKPELNKNQLRETLRKHIHDAPYLEVGVDRIVDQVVNPKVYSVFMPKIEDVVYKFLGIERPKSQRNGVCDLKDLLPTDLDPVSPESDRNSIKDETMESIDQDEKKLVNGEELKLSASNDENKTIDMNLIPVKKENIDIENEENLQAMDTSPVKAVLNSSFKSDETNKTEEEEEESPDFEPIDIMNLNESNMSNDSHLSGISELTSHRSGSPDFVTEFSRDNFDCSNQDSQLSKVSSNSRLSIVTDIGSSNHGSTPKSDVKEDSKGNKDNFKAVREFNTNSDSKFNFDVAKIKDNNKMSSSSKENSRDASDCKDGKLKDESKRKSSKDRHESRSSRDKDRDSRRRHSSKKRHRSKSKDKTESDSQESKDYSHKPKESKLKEMDKKEDASNETNDLKDRYKEKIRELREKIELTEKGKLGKMNQDLFKDKKESISTKEKEEHKKSSHKSSSRNSSHYSNKSSRSSESKESRDKSGSKHDERRHSNGKSDTKSSSKSRRDSKSDSKSNDRSRDKKRRDEKKSKSIDDHSSLRKNLNDRRSSDRDGSDGSSSKYSHKTSFSANTSSSKIGPATELTKDNKDQHSSGETDCMHDSLQMTFKSSDGVPKKVDPGSLEICLPLKKRRLLSEESQSEGASKKVRSSVRKASKRKLDQLETLKNDSDVASVPDEERVQIVEYADDEYDQPYPDKELILSLEETKKIILDGEPTPPALPKLSEMEQSIRQSLSEMMADHKMCETDDEPVKVSTVMDSCSLLEALTDDSSTDREALIASNTEDTTLASNITDTETSVINITENDEKSIERSEQSSENQKKIENLGIEENKEISACNEEEKAYEMNDQSVENQLEQMEACDKVVKQAEREDEEIKISEVQKNTDKVHMEIEKSTDIDKEQSFEKTEQNIDDIEKVDIDQDSKNKEENQQCEANQVNSDECNEEERLVIDEEVDEPEEDEIEKFKFIEKLSEVKKFEERNEKDKIESQSNQTKVVVLEDDTHCGVQCGFNTEDKQIDNKLTEQVNNDHIVKLSEPEIIDNSTIKSSELTEEAKEEIKNQLINELAKLNENDSDDDKHSKKDQTKEVTVDEHSKKDDTSVDVIKIDDLSTKSVDTKLDTEDDCDNIEIKNSIKVDNCEVKHSNNPEEKVEPIEENVEPLTENSFSAETSEETNSDLNTLASEEKDISLNEELQSSEKAHCSTDSRVDSPIEEDCRYFDNDNQKYLSFKRYFDQLESGADKVTEEKVESPVTELPSVVEPTEPSTIVSSPVKRKHTPSPVVDIIIKDNNNDGLTTTKETVVVEITNQEIPIEEPVVMIKKRKVGRMKKSSSSGSVTLPTPQPDQPQDKEQQQQAPVVNGENFMMPLSPDSDISVSSDKNLGGNLRDERRGQRSSQRYSSDDLYKPRLLFTSSTRRTRRYHQA